VPDPPTALTIAGSDSGGGAGVQADLKTFAAHRVHGTSALTAVTAQNTTAVLDVVVLEPAMVLAQIDAVLGDFEVRSVKTGMLANRVLVDLVAQAADFPIWSSIRCWSPRVATPSWRRTARRPT
jgi:hydroxymethylpyrimidine/phosphomethylpyrimidine kinase